jgi:hypothetical protein
MDMTLQLILPSLLLPMTLSLFLFVVSRHFKTLPWILPFVWLPSCFWLTGLPEQFPPQEANHWLWILAVVSSLTNISLMIHRTLSSYVQVGLLVLGIIILAWPVLDAQASMSLIIELLALLIVAGLFLRCTDFNHPKSPTLILSISSGGLGLVSTLGGSVLVGQLSGALASSLGVFALYEIYKRFLTPAVTTMQLSPAILLYFSLLLIARVYAEIPLVSSALLLIAPAPLIIRHKYGFIASLLCVATSLIWLLMTTESSSYY